MKLKNNNIKVLSAAISNRTNKNAKNLVRYANRTNRAAFEPLEGRTLMSAAPTGVSITTRYGDELVITASGANDSVSILQNGNMLGILGDNQLTMDPVPAGGVFVYTRGGTDTINVGPSVKAQTTLETIDGAATTISSSGTNVIAWTDSTDIVTGTASVHRVASFAGSVTKALGASLANPKDAGNTKVVTASLFGTGPVPADVNQGAAADCYFLSSIAAFSQAKNQVLQNSVVDMGDGTYTVQFYSAGKPVFVRVSDSFSTGPYAGGYEFAHPGADGSLWAPVMEKAFAYFRTGANTYASTNSGFMTEVYTDLNQQASVFLPGFTSTTAMYTKLSAALAAGNAVTMATSSSAPNLVSSHSYMLIAASDTNGVITYTVRNPWGVSGNKLENSQGIATLTAAQFASNFLEGATTLYV